MCSTLGTSDFQTELNMDEHQKDRTLLSTPPETVGERLLIAMDNTPAALDLVRAVAAHLPDPPHTHVTLFHYLPPLLWEHGGDDTNPAARQELEHELEQVQLMEEREEEATDRYFHQAATILQRAGVPTNHIQTKIDGDAADAAHSVLAEVRSGGYSAVVVGQGHASILDRLLGLSLVDVLHKQAGEVTVWAL